jgi:hypothetical protein
LLDVNGHWRDIPLKWGGTARELIKFPCHRDGLQLGCIDVIVVIPKVHYWSVAMKYSAALKSPMGTLNDALDIPELTQITMFFSLEHIPRFPPLKINYEVRHLHSVYTLCELFNRYVLGVHKLQELVGRVRG